MFKQYLRIVASGAVLAVMVGVGVSCGTKDIQIETRRVEHVDVERIEHTETVID